MKKLSLIFAFISIVIMAKAQDVIITKDSERIEAQITEISDDEVKFKRLDNLDGPVFVLTGAKVASIVFSNGDVFVFKEQHQRPLPNDGEAESEDQVASQLVEMLQSSENQVISSQETVVSYVDGVAALKMGDGNNQSGFYIGGQKIKEREYRKMSKENCPEAFRLLRKARVVENTLGPLAVSAMAAGLVLEIKGLLELSDGNKEEGRVLLLACGGSFLLSLPILGLSNTISTKLRHRSVDAYNQKQVGRVKENEVSIYVGLTANGAGISINF